MKYSTYRGYQIEHLTDGYRIAGGTLDLHRTLKAAKAEIDAEFAKKPIDEQFTDEQLEDFYRMLERREEGLV